MVSLMLILSGELAKNRKELTCQSLKCEMLSKNTITERLLFVESLLVLNQENLPISLGLLEQGSQPLFELYIEK